MFDEKKNRRKSLQQQKSSNLADVEKRSVRHQAPYVAESRYYMDKTTSTEIAAETYDPLGLSLWKEEVGWDEVLPAHLTKTWNEITSSWTASKIVLPRRLLTGTKNSSRLKFAFSRTLQRPDIEYFSSCVQNSIIATESPMTITNRAANYQRPSIMGQRKLISIMTQKPPLIRQSYGRNGPRRH
ncbi:hypothetical protein COOONC_00876 [Cooperia oncophora]